MAWRFPAGWLLRSAPYSTALSSSSVKWYLYLCPAAPSVPGLRAALCGGLGYGGESDPGGPVPRAEPSLGGKGTGSLV